MTTLLVFAAVELGALLLLLLFILTAPEGTEDVNGFRVTGPSWWQKLRERSNAPPEPAATTFPPIHRRGRWHA